MSDSASKPVTLRTLRRMAEADTPFACLTAYDYTTAKWLGRAGVPVLLVKKDISEAFKWLWMSLADVGRVGTDVPGEAFGVSGLITALYLVMVFGWSGAPGEWMAFAWAMKLLHAAFGSPDPLWDDAPAFSSAFLMDDQVLVEPDIGRRVWRSVRLAEQAAALALGPLAVNRAKDAEEGCPKPPSSSGA